MGYEYNDDVKKRLRRLEGQVRGVLRLMEEGKSCKDVITQLSAVRSAADKAIAQIVAENLEQCIIEEQAAGGDTRRMVKEAIELLVKSR
ncbi:Copper-sensing transcriptional repressor RicR [Paenibacillus plantiphilus]|uniref:Copper-sensing transcriptional repressor RicR n=1 Tax=Paenibacillus plantiphilus TaxID=2905650 RepID=A0ABM9CC63_9BACL|nr:metal-sensitive transcriptional regulator [Paenibacillus plantiphilus]CAH1209102.1 Copper-sensing transcriptional repressor RicR [Paenibacillus plantiphilus]